MGDHFVGDCYFFARPWEQVKTMESTELSVMPMWVTFPKFPLEICMIGRKLGKPIKMDGATVKGEECYAKLLVSMDARKDFPLSLKINIKCQDGGDDVKDERWSTKIHLQNLKSANVLDIEHPSTRRTSRNPLLEGRIQW